MAVEKAQAIDRQRPKAIPTWLRVAIRFLAAAAAFGAEGIHLSVLENYYQVWWGYAVFFLVVAIVQGILGVSLLFDDPGPWTVRLGVLFNLVVAIVWVVTRFGGIPGWTPFIPLPVGDLDLTATVLELALVTLLLILGRTRSGPSRGVASITAILRHARLGS